MSTEFGTWHHGLVARWWAEFNVAEPEELAYFGAAIRKFCEPALDLGCGTGRILFPLIAEGLDVDDVDISADMIALAQAGAAKRGFKPKLTVQPMHELDIARMYRTIYMCGAFGLGGRLDYDRRAFAMSQSRPATRAGRPPPSTARSPSWPTSNSAYRLGAVVATIC